MAIYSFSGQYVGPSHKLKSVVGAAAYRAGERLIDPRTGEVHDFRAKQVAHREIIAPEGAPSWVLDRQHLWGAAELARNRVKGVTARELRIALPRELTRDQQFALVREFLRDEFVSRGMVADWSLHDEAGKDQPHIHVMLTMRALGPERFGNKVREWDERSLFRNWREQWAVHANRALELAGREERIDHRSYADRGINLEPQPKRYRHVDEMHRDGRDLSARMEKVRRVARSNGRLILADPTIPLRLLTDKRATFRREDLLKVLNTHTADAEQFTACLHAVMASPELVALGPDDKGVERFTSQEMLAVEKRLLEAGDVLAAGSAHRVAKRHVESALGRANERLALEAAMRGDTEVPTVSEEQRRAVAHLVRSSGDIALVEGHAGTGKSFLLGIAREAWEAQGYTVVGGALAGKAAEGLTDSSGIEARTLASWERAWTFNQDQLTDKHVLVIDEAGMLGSRQLGRVLDHARAMGAKVVLVGDSRQLQAIEAGSPFRALVERLGAETLSEIRRQRVAWQREASSAFASGRAEEALAAYHAKGHVLAHMTSEEARASVVEAWTKGLAETSIEKQLMFAYRRDDVHALNLGARAVRRERGELGKDFTITTVHGERSAERTFAAGDRILFGKNDRKLGVKNGTFGTIESMNADRMLVRLDGEDERRVLVDLREYQHLDHGYAATVHKSQGVTLERAYVLASKLFDASASYVAMSRQRAHVELHWARDEFGSQHKMMQMLSRERPKELALELIADRSVTLDEVLRDDSQFALLSPVEQRRLIREAAAVPIEPGRPIAIHLEAELRAQPEVVEAFQKREKAAKRVQEAQAELNAYRGASWLEKRPGGERALEQQLAERQAEARAAAKLADERLKDPVLIERVRQQLGAHNARVGQWHQRIKRWQGQVDAVEREGAREHVLEGLPEPLRGGARWATVEDAGKALQVVGVLPEPLRVGERAERVAVFKAGDGAVLLSEVRRHEVERLARGAVVQLERGVRGSLTVTRGDRGRGHER